MRQNGRRLAGGNATPRCSLQVEARRGVAPICQPLGLFHRSLAPDKLYAHLIAESGIEELGEMGNDLLLRTLGGTVRNGICLAPLGVQALELINISHPDEAERAVTLLKHDGRLHARDVGDDVGGI